MNSPVDKHLVEELALGNFKAFKAVFDQYYRALHHFAVSYLKNEEDATDIVQSVFLILWERRESLRPDTNLLSYVFTIAKNQCINYLDHVKAKSNYLSKQEQHWNELQLNYYSLEKFNAINLVYDELESDLNKTLADLPPDISKIFGMSRFQGLKYSEIADKLGISIKTVEKKMSIALLRLRESLKKYYYLIFLIGI
jgi:RNA polymerase sigma-70 factor, ECF subfamily